MNTPQFGWVLSRLPCRPQPVPPIYQPELIARAVVHMAERPRREMWLTGRTILAIVGNRVVPGYLDRRLGRRGVASQQTDEPADADRPANLWEPVPGGRSRRRGRPWPVAPQSRVTRCASGGVPAPKGYGPQPVGRASR